MVELYGMEKPPDGDTDPEGWSVKLVGRDEDPIPELEEPEEPETNLLDRLDRLPIAEGVDAMPVLEP